MATDTWAPGGSCPALSITAAGGAHAVGGSPLPGSFPPDKEKAPKGYELQLEHTDQTLLAQKVLHMLTKQENEMGRL